MNCKEDTQKNNNRFSRREKNEKEFRVLKRTKQSEDAVAEQNDHSEEKHERSLSIKNLGKKLRNNGKLNKAQREHDKVEEVIDQAKMNIAIKKTKQKFFMR